MATGRLRWTRVRPYFVSRTWIVDFDCKCAWWYTLPGSNMDYETHYCSINEEYTRPSWKPPTCTQPRHHVVSEFVALIFSYFFWCLSTTTLKFIKSSPLKSYHPTIGSLDYFQFAFVLTDIFFGDDPNIVWEKWSSKLQFHNPLVELGSDGFYLNTSCFRISGCVPQLVTSRYIYNALSKGPIKS